jgi:branched-chain amino acid transport system ATP-binding protein
MTDPVLLALDEPSLGLAPLIIDRIYEVIAAARRDEDDGAAGRAERAARARYRRLRLYPGDRPRRARRYCAKLSSNEDVQEFYLGVSNSGRKSLRDVKHYKRRKRWLS